MTDQNFARRIRDVPRSFIREILKDALQPGTISFAGGLPNPELFPLKEIQAASARVYQKYGSAVLQYSPTEGLLSLRQWIAANYRTKGIDVDPDQVLITNGSQQAMDLLGKVLLDEGDGLIIEDPSYIGAIQAFSLFQPRFLPVALNENGIDTADLQKALREKPKVFYAIPNFQNPTGITYPRANRQEVAALLRDTPVLVIEDNPYGDLRFSGTEQPSLATFLPERCILLGTFSKTIVPGFRIGWMVAPAWLMEKLIVAKQGSDLHTNQLSQCIVDEYLRENSLDEHIERIRRNYGQRKQVMVDAITRCFPAGISHTKPDGGMFLWLTAPGTDVMKLFHRCAANKVVFVPGDPFFVGRKDTHTLRLNYSCVSEANIRTGIERMGDVLKDL